MKLIGALQGVSAIDALGVEPLAQAGVRDVWRWYWLGAMRNCMLCMRFVAWLHHKQSLRTRSGMPDVAGCMVSVARPASSIELTRIHLAFLSSTLAAFAFVLWLAVGSTAAPL